MIKNIPYILSFIYIFVYTTNISILGLETDDLRDINTVSWFGYLMVCVNLFLVFHLVRKMNCLKFFIIENKIFFIVVFFFIVSCLWSDNRWVALKKIVNFLGIVVSLIIIMFENKQYLWKMLLIYVMISCFLSLFLIIVFPDLGFMVYDGSFLPKGIFGHKNALGIFSAIGCLICLYYYLNISKKKYLMFLLIVCLFLLFLSKSATSIIALFVMFLSYLLLKSLKNKLEIIFIYLSLILVILILNSLSTFNIIEFVFNYLGKDSSFTGRDMIWTMLIKIGMQQPIFGYGYCSFFRGDETEWVTNIIGWKAAHAHNGLLQIFLETGFVGLTITIVFLVDLVKRSIKNKNILILSFIPFILAYNFSETGLFNKSFISTFIIGLYFYLNEQKKIYE